MANWETVKEVAKNTSTENFYVEKFINTPGEYPASFRVLVSAPVGRIIGGTLNVGSTEKSASVRNDSIGQVSRGIFVDPSIKALVDSQPAILSNIAQGGVRYPLYVSRSFGGTQVETAIATQHKTTVAAHGIDITAPALPVELARAAKDIARTLGPAYGVLCGMDFIRDADGNYYLLEINNNPEIDLLIEQTGVADPDAIRIRIIDQVLGDLECASRK